jgi:hypothetical protein
MSRKIPSKAAIVHRVRHTLEEYAIIAAYLYVCFGAMLLLRASVLKDAGIGYMPWGLAAIKALILGKFMLLGNEMGLGERFAGKPLIYPTLYRSLVFVVYLFVLMVIEEVVVGAVHGHTIAQSLYDVVGNKFFEMAASVVIMFAALFPYFAFRQLAAMLGEGRLRRLFFVDARWP